MALMVLDPDVEQRLKKEREASGADRYDEVWEGVYMMAPLANNKHQDLQAWFAFAFRASLGSQEDVRVHCRANVSDRDDHWTHNYRIPDVVVVFPNGKARDCDTHWCGGPDFCVEILSEGDRSREKFDFYSAIGVRELLLVDPYQWTLELYRLDAGALRLVGETTLENPSVLTSEVLPTSFKIISGQPRPRIEVTHRDGVQHWLV